jgi:hypothetical protein
LPPRGYAEDEVSSISGSEPPCPIPGIGETTVATAD